MELELLTPRTSEAPFGHTWEPSIAAFGDDVMVAYINYSDADATTYAADGEDGKRVGVAVSRDRGLSFAAPSEAVATTGLYSTDPVIRAHTDGSFWFAMLGQGPDEIVLARAMAGTAWELVYTITASDLLDKEWFALDATSVWLGTTADAPTPSYHHVTFDGTVLGTAESTAYGVIGMYVEAGAAHFARMPEGQALDVPIYRWDGTSPPVQEGASLPSGLTGAPGEMPVLFYASTASLGVTPDGGQWIVRTVQRDGAPAIVLRIRRLPDEGTDIPISEPGATALLPTAIVDEDGRLRVVYYDTSGTRGVLRTTRSLSTDWTEGFEPSTLIDPDACPGERWFPVFGADPSIGGRRLREYIDLSLSERRVHIAWTHAPVAPSRVRAAFIDY